MARYFCHEHPEVLVVDTQVVEARPGAVALQQTPFYPGGGGQLTDRGVLRWAGGETRIIAIESDVRHAAGLICPRPVAPASCAS
jgi:misacylated tRNA(Ala) deacylase